MKRGLILFPTILFVFILFSPSVFAQDAFRLEAGGGLEYVDKHGECRIVENRWSSKDVLVPARSSAEWLEFRIHYPAGVEINDCPVGEGITTCTELQNMTLTGSYQLAQNIDCSATSGWNGGAGFEPIGTGTGTGRFSGTFNGNGFKITGLYINRNSMYQGLFGSVHPDGVIKNVGLEGVNITSNTWRIGALVGYNWGTITNSYAKGQINGGGPETGGLIGRNESPGTITDSYAEVTVTTSSDRAGGLIGVDNNGTITNSHATGNVTSTGNLNQIGGLVGRMDGGSTTITNSYATGNVSSPLNSGTGIGGLVGWGYGTISNSYATGRVDGYRYVGGLVGYVYGSTTIADSYAEGIVDGGDYNVGGLVGEIGSSGNSSILNSYSISPTVTGRYAVGGLVGIIRNVSVSISDSYSTAHTSSSDNSSHIGGLVGYIDDNIVSVSILNSYATGNVSGGGNIGGLVGYTNSVNVTISGSHATGAVSGTGTYVGGLVGINKATITHSYATGNVTLDGEHTAGGLVGLTYEPIYYSYATGDVTIIGNHVRAGGLAGWNAYNSAGIHYSYATGNVSGYRRVGGLIGEVSNNSNVSNSYATGNATASSYQVGGLVGLHSSSANTISNSYSTGIPSGSSITGGLVGSNSATVTNSFWDTQTSGFASSDGGTGKTTSEMKNVRTFTDTSWSSGLSSPWDFVGDPYNDSATGDSWDIDTGKNNGYPFLTMFPEAGSSGDPNFKIEVPIEMIDRGISSVAGSWRTFDRTTVSLNTNDYDGITQYYFEVVVRNFESTARRVDLRSSDAYYTHITVPGSSGYLRTRTSFNPKQGLENYFVTLEGTTSHHDIQVYAARIIIQQTGPTKTRIQIPLINGREDNYSKGYTYSVDSTTSTSYTQGTPEHYSLWHRDDSSWINYASGNAFTLEAVMRGSSSDTTANLSLFNRTDGTQVAVSEVSTSGTGRNLVTTDFSPSATNFLNNKDYELRLRRSAGSGSADLYRAALYVRLDNPEALELYYRFQQHRNVTVVTHADRRFQRILIEKNRFTDPRFYYQAVGYETSQGYGSMSLLNAGNSDTWLQGSIYNATESINFGGSTSKQLVRTSAFDVGQNDRFIGLSGYVRGETKYVSGFLVVKVAPPEEPKRPIIKRVTTGSIELEWEDVPGAKQYVVERAPDSGGSPGTFSEVATTSNLSYEDTNLQRGTNYWYRIRAVNYNGSVASPAARMATSEVSAWFSNWQYRRKITVNASQVEESLTNFPVYVDFSNLGSNFFSSIQADGSDIKIVKNDGRTRLPREIVFLGSGEGGLYFKADSLSATSNTDFYIYYGNSDDMGKERVSDVWTNNFINVHHLEESGGQEYNRFIDSSPKAIHGRGDGSSGTAPTVIDGKIGKAQQLTPGQAQVITLPYSYNFDFPDGVNFSMSAWVNINDGSRNNAIIGTGNPYNNDGNGIIFRYLSSGRLNIVINNGSGSERSSSSNSFGNIGGDWHHVAITGDRTGNATFYLNGNSVGTGWIGDKSGSGYSLGRTVIRIGGYGDSLISSHVFEGGIDDVRISTGIRSAGWFKTQYNNQNSPTTFFSFSEEESMLIPATPGVPTYTNIEETTLTVNWTSASGADYYKIERAPDVSGNPGTFSEVGTATGTSFNDSGLSDKTN